MTSKRLRVVHYLNQFFGGLGGEDKASERPRMTEGPCGPGKLIQSMLGENGDVVATIICGDDYAAENIDAVADEIVELMRPYRPDVFVAGPAFEAGRYGVACGAISKRVQDKLKIPAVTAMYDENPGVELFHKDVYIVRTGDSVRTMSDAIEKMVNIAMKLASGEPIGKPADAGYFPRGMLVNEECERSGAERVIAMLLDKLHGRPFEPEVLQPTHFPVSPAPAIKDLGSAIIALVTDGGLVPAGNPDGIESKNATHYAGYDLKDVVTLVADDYDVNHSGYATVFARQDPHRLIPLDVLREMEKEKVIGKVHERFYTTTGVATKLEIARRMGQSIAEKLKADGVSGVILTST